MKPQDLVRFRHNRDMTQTDLAVELGVTLRSVQRWEKGEAPITKMLELAMETLRARSPSVFD